MLTLRLILSFSLLAASALAQTTSPRFSFVIPLGVGNAAAPYSNRVAPGYYMAVAFPMDPDLNTGDFAVDIADAGGKVFRVPLRPHPANASPMWALVPKDAALGRATVTLLDDKRMPFRQTTVATVEIVATAPGLFTKNYKGNGPAQAITYAGAVPTRNALTAAAVPGRFVALFGMGLGNATAADVTVEIAGRPVAATYAGSQGGGLDQINFLVPKDAYLGCYVPVAIRVRGILSNQATLSIHSDTFACAHPLGLSYSDLRMLDYGGGGVPLANGGRIPLTSFDVEGYRVGPIASGIASLLLLQADSNVVWKYAGTQMPDSMYLSCADMDPGGGASLIVGFGGVNEAGEAVTLAGPGGKQLVIPSPYSAVVPAGQVPFVSPGVWQISAPGGSAVVGFSQTFVMPPSLTSLNIVSGATIPKDRDFRLTWNPTGFAGSDVVTVELYGSTGAARCRTHAWAGQVTVPKALLASATSMQVSVGPHPAARTQFSILRNDGYSMRASVNVQLAETFSIKVE